MSCAPAGPVSSSAAIAAPASAPALRPLGLMTGRLLPNEAVDQQAHRQPVFRPVEEQRLPVPPDIQMLVAADHRQVVGETPARQRLGMPRQTAAELDRSLYRRRRREPRRTTGRRLEIRPARRQSTRPTCRSGPPTATTMWSRAKGQETDDADADQQIQAGASGVDDAIADQAPERRDRTATVSFGAAARSRRR